MKTIGSSLFLALTLSAMTHAANPQFVPQKPVCKVPYQLFTPNMEPGKKYPLVLFLHGAGERGDNNTAQLKHGTHEFIKPENQAKHPCFVIAPQCPKEQWWSGENLDEALAIVKKFTRDPRIDTRRLYITGLSMGGFGTWSALEKQPDLFAAAIPICGGGNPTSVERFKHVPIRAFHGDADKVITPDKSQTMIDALVAAGAKNATLTIYPNVSHNSWTQTYANPEIHNWLFQQSR